MTRDEILAMEAGPELNTLMAEEVMGWVDNGSGWWRSPYDVGPNQSLLGIVWAAEGMDAFAPSEDIEAAWEVVNHLLEQDSIAAVEIQKWKKEPVEWEVFVREKGLWQPGYWANGEIAPLAISRAALLAAMEGEA